jgi:hypothetical protein
MFPDLTKFTDADKLRKLMANARRLGHDDYAFECQLRVAEVAGNAYKDELERGFWTAVTCAEEFKTQEKGKTIRLISTRQKHKRVGAQQCLNDWAVAPEVSDGFAVLASHGREDLTGESVVVRYADRFSPAAVASAERKLAACSAAPAAAEPGDPAE